MQFVVKINYHSFYNKIVKNIVSLLESLHFIIQGTNGGVSWIGLLCSTIGGLIVGLIYYIVILNTVDTAVLQLAAPQWPVIIIAGFAGFFGSILDSVLGATLQYSGNVNIFSNLVSSCLVL